MELLARYGEPFVHRRTPVVLTTAEADDSELVKKPSSPQELRSIVQKVIESPPG
jgi:hypothetical protein